MPDYIITIHMKIGKNKTGVRWHPSYDSDHVRTLVEEKVRKSIGMSIVKWIDLEVIGRSSGEKMETKTL